MSQISPLMFFSLEKKVFSWTYLLKKTLRRTKYLISPVIRDAVISPKIRDILFKLIQIEVQCCKNYFKISLSQEFGASRNNIGKEPHKPHPNWKITNIEYLQRIFALQCKWYYFAILQSGIKFVEQQFTFSQF